MVIKQEHYNNCFKFSCKYIVRRFSMKKELPLGIPPIRCFLFDALPLSIISINDNYLPWLYSNYIQVCCRKNILDSNELFLQFYGPDQAFCAPFLKKQYISWNVISKCNIDIINLIKENININYYYYGYVDDFYLPFRPSYNKYHEPHDIFIYGYDDNRKIFNVLGYANKTFKTFEIQYGDFIKAFYNNIWDKEIYYWIDRIYLFQYNKTAEYDLDLLLIRELMEDYLYSKNTSEKYRRYTKPISDNIFGLQTYKAISEYYNLLNENKVRCDNKVPYILLEHKRCMKSRLSYIMEKFKDSSFSQYVDEYIELEKKSNLLLDFSIKHKIKQNERNISNSLKLINEIEFSEKDIIKEVILKIEMLV